MNYDVITPSGVHVTRLNSVLVAKQGLDEAAVEVIKQLHLRRYQLETEMDSCKDRAEMRVFHIALLQNNRKLQEAWGFPVNDDYYRFWEEPHCECPRLDNEDVFPSGYYTVNLACPVHGVLE